MDDGKADDPEEELDADATAELMRRWRVGGPFWSGDADPWSLAEAAGQVRGKLHDPLVLVGWLLGRPAFAPDGRRHGEGDLRAAFAAEVMGRRWRDPFTGVPTTLPAIVELLGLWRGWIDANRRIGAAAGMAPWKRQAIARFLWDGEGSPPFAAAPVAAERAAGGAVACWPSRVDEADVIALRDAGVPIAWVEDGFLRSNGLGADCRPPASVVVDFTGIYYDPAGPSDLETLLATYDFPPVLLDRARRLRERIVAARIGKYGVSRGERLDLPEGRRVVLAVGQVEDDLSVRRGGGEAAGNAPFLGQVRAAEPDAFILYRPHPDVLAGHRMGHLHATDALRWADRVEGGGDLLDLIERVDAVHVLSSLTGFEALLRDRPVFVHGQPFYAGWGLTNDLCAQPFRRGRRLSVDALAAAALILYPRYMDPVTGLPCPPEVLVERMATGKAAGDSLLTGLRRAQGRMRRGIALVREALA